MGSLLALCLVAAPKPAFRIPPDRVAGGEHWRLETAGGVVHVWRPGGYDRRSAGTVVYVHGFTVDADGAWNQHALAQQFEASGRNAIFLVPEAPVTAEENPRWASLRDLMATVAGRVGLAFPGGPCVVVGHSAAHLTVVPWLKTARVSQVILLDALYRGDVAALRAWLRRGGGRLTLVAPDPPDATEELLRGFPDVVHCGAIPSPATGFTRRERGARIACVRSQYGHQEMVTDGVAIAPLLGLTRLAPIGVRSVSARR
jgi:hypothetical protein